MDYYEKGDCIEIKADGKPMGFLRARDWKLIERLKSLSEITLSVIPKGKEPEIKKRPPVEVD